MREARHLPSLLCRLLPLGILVLLAGCSTPRSPQPANSRPFEFQTDTFAYANGLVWEYYYDVDGEWQHRRNPDDPQYTHHCFVVARSARQFFQHARFAPELPAVDTETYRELVREVVSRDPAREDAPEDRVVIPGFANLYNFSLAHEAVLKETCGGAIESYFQRGHWRMIFPFTGSGKEREAQALAQSIQSNRPPVVHVSTFPRIMINHALLLYDVRTNDTGLTFAAYDPNQPEQPATLIFDKADQEFHFPANNYWRGGELNVYEIYRAWNY